MRDRKCKPIQNRDQKMKYRHYKGGIYEIVCVAKLETDPTVSMIVYKSSDGTIWTRPEEVFFESMKVNDAFLPRFAPVSLVSAEKLLTP